MELGRKTRVLAEALEPFDINGRTIVLADLANIDHGYTAQESLQVYRQIEVSGRSHFARDLKKLFEENRRKLALSLGTDAMQLVSELTDAEQEKKDAENIKKHEGEKKKKKDQAPIAKAVRAKGQDQNDMADTLDVDKSTISRIKTGTRNPSFDLLKKIKDTYGHGVVNQLLGT